MKSKVFSYPVTIKEIYLDTFGHVNNAVYFTLFEEARWDLITKNGYGLTKIQETGLGPTILEIKVRYLRELRPRDEVLIETRLLSYEKKIGILEQKMVRGTEICSLAEFTIAFFNLKERKLILPTADWLNAIGAEI